MAALHQTGRTADDLELNGGLEARRHAPAERSALILFSMGNGAKMMIGFG